MSTKAALGGTGIVGGGAATGYGVYRSLQSEDLKFKSGTIGEKIIIAGFEVEEKELGRDCITKLKGKYSDETTYKTAIVTCLPTTFKERANKLGLEVLDPKRIEGSNVDSSGADKGTKAEQKKAIESLKETSSAAGNNFSDAKSKVKEYCEKDYQISNSTTTEEGYKFLKICTKGKTEEELNKSLSKDFGFKQDTYKTKMTKAKFELKDNLTSPCATEALNKPFHALTEDYKTTVKNCSKTDKFSLKVTSEGLIKLATSDIKDSDADGKSKGEKFKDAIITLNTEQTNTAGDTLEKAKDKVKTFCETDTSLTEQINDEQGHKYLKICVKDGTSTKLEDALKQPFGYR